MIQQPAKYDERLSGFSITRCRSMSARGAPARRLGLLVLGFINIAGEKLIRRKSCGIAVYAGNRGCRLQSGISSLPGAACPSLMQIGSQFVNGRAERQEYFANRDPVADSRNEWPYGRGVHGRASARQDSGNFALSSHFQSVITPGGSRYYPRSHRGPMNGVVWGGLYVHLKNESLDPKALEDEVARLTIDDDVTRKAGIYASSAHLRVLGIVSIRAAHRGHEADGVRSTSKGHLQGMREGV